MTAQAEILKGAIDPALDLLTASGIRSDDRARQMLLAIAGQESGCKYRRQMGDGPARGLWQFERGGGVRGVLTHPSSQKAASRLCAMRGVADDAPTAWAALEHDDVLAAGFARLLLYTDPKPLPDDEAAGWALYLRCWRPGKPHPATWAGHWAAAERALFQGAD